MRTCVAMLCLCAVGMTSSVAQATVDGILFANIAFEEPQDEGFYCYTRVPVYGEIGIPAAIVADASLSPSFAYLSVSMPGGYKERQEIDGRSYLNINAIARGAAIKHTYINDSYSKSGVLEYEVELDLTDLATENGTSLEGRKQTITQAKLAVLALAKNLKEGSSAGLYRLKLSFKGLPSQDGLEGEPVLASSNWPYTGASPVLAAYEKELITKWCPGGKASALYDHDTKADTAAPEHPATSAGCSTGASHSGAGSLCVVALLLLGLVVRRVRL